jgi:hypothetical protein
VLTLVLTATFSLSEANAGRLKRRCLNSPLTGRMVNRWNYTPKKRVSRPAEDPVQQDTSLGAPASMGC